MATLAELYSIKNQFIPHDLLGKIAGAVMVKANAIVEETTPNVNRIAWAKAAFKDPLAVADDLMGALLGANAAATVTAITDASDVAIQAAVDAAVDALFPA